MERRFLIICTLLVGACQAGPSGQRPSYEPRKAGHEAGHTVYALAHPEAFDFYSVSIEATNGATNVGFKPDGGIARERLMLSELVAGCVAETLFYEGAPCSLDSDDRPKLDALAKKLASQTPGLTAEALVEAARVDAYATLLARKDQLANVANNLLANGRIPR